MHGPMNKDGLLALYAYSAYANKRLLDTVEKLTEQQFTQQCSPSHNSVRGLLTHMLECEAFFLAHCQGISDSFELGDVSTLPAIRRYWSNLEQQQLDFIKSLNETDLAADLPIEIKKQPLVFPVWELLVQPIIHSVHHRGELSIVLTELGYPLPTLDIILHFIQHSGQNWQ